LPELKLLKTEAEQDAATNSSAEAKKKTMVWVGSMKGHRLRKMVKAEEEETPAISDVQTGFKDEEVVEEDDDDGAGQSTPAAAVTSPKQSTSDIAGSVPDSTGEKRKQESSSEKLYTVIPPTSVTLQSVDSAEMTDEVEKEAEMEEQREDTAESAPKRSRQRVRQKPEKKVDASGGYDASNPDYAMWMPPDNQHGDGRTKLNEKFGDRY
jgi:hypothetical protein